MKKLFFLVLACAIVLSPTNQVFAGELETNYNLSTRYDFAKYENETKAKDVEEEVMEKVFTEDDLDDIPAVSQFEDDIYYHENSSGNHWYSKACVATSVSIMILRRACLDGYEYDGDPFSTEAVIDVLENISDQGSMFRQSDCNLYWQGRCNVDVFTKDGESYFAQIETHPASQENLAVLLDEHPEGILVYGRHNEAHHGVLVTKYFDDETYEVYDSATGTIEIRDYTHLNGHENKSYKFASLVIEE